MSAWGDPEDVIVSFNATQVGLERTAAIFCDLPLAIDERQLAGHNQELLEKIIYMISSGTGKVRGTKTGGVQATQKWRTVALSTGEEPISTENSQTGIQTRMIEIFSGPFNNEEEAAAMYQEISDNFGWAGPAFIRHLVKVSEESVREWFKKMSDYLHGCANGRSGSHISSVAVVALADAMLDTWLFSEEETQAEDDKLVLNGYSWERAKTMARNMLMEQMSAEASDVNENAVQFVVDWVESNAAYFGKDVNGTRLGYWSEKVDKAVDVFPSILKAAIRKADYSPRKTLKYMAVHGYITAGKNANGSDSFLVQERHGTDNKSGKYTQVLMGKIQEDMRQRRGGGASEDGKNGETKKKINTSFDDFIPVDDSIDLPF